MKVSRELPFLLLLAFSLVRLPAQEQLIAVQEETEIDWAYEINLLGKELAVEPPVRSVAPMVYDSKNKVIVMFGA